MLDKQHCLHNCNLFLFSRLLQTSFYWIIVTSCERIQARLSLKSTLLPTERCPCPWLAGWTGWSLEVQPNPFYDDFVWNKESATDLQLSWLPWLLFDLCKIQTRSLHGARSDLIHWDQNHSQTPMVWAAATDQREKWDINPACFSVRTTFQNRICKNKRTEEEEIKAPVESSRQETKNGSFQPTSCFWTMSTSKRHQVLVLCFPPTFSLQPWPSKSASKLLNANKLLLTTHKWGEQWQSTQSAALPSSLLTNQVP